MITISEPAALRFHSQTNLLPKSRMTDERTPTTMTTMPSDLRRPHAPSLISTSTDYRSRSNHPGDNYYSFTRSTLKNKSFLVPTRLALKRQRASLKDPLRPIEPIQPHSLQMELGNPDDILIRWSPPSQTTDHEIQTEFSAEQNHLQHSSHFPGPLRMNTPYNAPADIALLLKEKPVNSHPITGKILHQYTEETGNPSPCSYVLPRKSLREKNAPAFTFGSRCLVEKNGGARTSWNKQWFAHSDPFTTKVDFNREVTWPTPLDYHVPPTLGIQPTKVSFPAWSMGTRIHNNLPSLDIDGPSPNSYDANAAFQAIKAKNTSITLKSRPGGTQIVSKSSADLVPGPGAHDQDHFLSNKVSAPKYSFGRRLPTSYSQDPYVNSLPPIPS